MGKDGLRPTTEEVCASAAFTFTENDSVAALAELPITGKEELSDTEREAVAGGMTLDALKMLNEVLVNIAMAQAELSKQIVRNLRG